MKNQLKTFLLSLLTPGLGYFQNGDKKSFYKTIALFFAVIIASVMVRVVIHFRGLLFVFIALTAIYIVAVIHATSKRKTATQKIKNANLKKLFFTVTFILVTGLSFANRRIVMGFDIMRMDVPVMHPAILEGDKFLVDTWAYKRNLPKRGDIIAHSFNGQQGLYLNRIIAVANDKIEIKNGTVFLNEQILNEPGVLPANVTKPESKDMKALVIPPGHYFVMGDNRDASFGDSRFSGTITIDNIVGKATDVISSYDQSTIGKRLN